MALAVAADIAILPASKAKTTPSQVATNLRSDDPKTRRKARVDLALLTGIFYPTFSQWARDNDPNWSFQGVPRG